MALSSPTVFVIVEDDLKPDLTGSLVDANDNAVDRSAQTLRLAVKAATGGGGGSDVTATWNGTAPKLVWTSSNKRALGVHLARWLTDSAGSTRWSFPTEDPFTIIVVAKTGA